MSENEIGKENKEEITRERIETEYSDIVKVSDRDEQDNLELFCYLKCTNDSPEFVKRCRGVVFHENRLVMQAFPYTADYAHTDMDTLEDVLAIRPSGTHLICPSGRSNNFRDFTVFDSYEGTLLRVFNYNGRWFLSTHRKLDAFRSKWSSRESFGTHFLSALQEEMTHNMELKNAISKRNESTLLAKFFATLDPEKQYMFLLLNNTENRIVCTPPERPTMYHVGTFVDNKLTLDDNVFVTKPRRHNFMNIDELVDYVNNIDYTKLQGVICFGKDNTQIKVHHSHYLELFRVRGNEPSLKFRYLQVRMNSDLVDKLYALYPEYEKEFRDCENTLYDIARSILSAYIARFINRKYVVVPQEEYEVIRMCHTWHLQDKFNNRICLEKVIDVLNCQTPTQLNQMIKRFKSENIYRRNEDVNEPRERTLRRDFDNFPKLST